MCIICQLNGFILYKAMLKVTKKGGVADTHAAAPYERLKGMTASSAAATTIKLHRKIVYLSASVGCEVPWVWCLKRRVDLSGG